MRNIALYVTYLGTHYHGWQVQKRLATVGQTLEDACAMVVGHKVHVTGCGRTDAGVHAKCYVANFRTDSRIPVDRLPYALNTHLPHDIVVTNAFEVHEDFNAIGSCVRKEYTYLIYNSRIKDPFYVDRAKALIPILVPLFISAFRRADELATAMECRCYQGGEGRTKLKQLHYTQLDFTAYAIGAVLILGVLAAGRIG